MTPLRRSFAAWLIVLGLLLPAAPLRAQSAPSQDPSRSFEERAAWLVSRMTLEEKIAQMNYSSPAIERLGIPAYNWWNECLHGVARAGLATVFPQAIGLAATWNPPFIEQLATAISDEARAKHHQFARLGKRGIYQGLTFWSPNINIFRDPRWGRGMETYGEDPFLTSRIGVAFVRGLQGQDPRYLKVIATAKHFAVHSGPEPERHSFDARISPRDLRETYLPAFEALLKEGGAWSVMCAYNRYQGEPCCGSSLLLQQILRGEWRFPGYVVSDCWAIRDFYKGHNVVPDAAAASALAVKRGTDLECGVDYPSLARAVQRGLISEKEIDTAVTRLMLARLKLGLFDPESMTAYARLPYSLVNSPAHQALARQAAHQSMVLLKNEKQLLPLSRQLKTIAVIGPNADDQEVLLGNYNGIPADPVTLLRGLREKAGSRTRVLYAIGCPLAEGMPMLTPVPTEVLYTSAERGQQGLQAEYFKNASFSGSPLYTQVDARIHFRWWEKAPRADLPDDDFSVRWSGVLVPPRSGRYAVGGQGQRGFRIFLDDRQIVASDNMHEGTKTFEFVELQANRVYRLRVEYWDIGSDAAMSLLWAPPADPQEQLEEALAAARQAELVILAMGLSPRLEGEEMKVAVEGFQGGDRLTLDLPPIQSRLIRAVAALGKPVVLVLFNGSAISINWEQDHLPAILEAWYPGQAGGAAIADVLFGDVSPAGRLPVTFYKGVNQLPPFADYSMSGRTYRYLGSEPLYPFGHGLSYASYRYSQLTVAQRIAAGQPVDVSVQVENTSSRAGDEVVQVYLRHRPGHASSALKTLVGLQRVHLLPGQKQSVTLRIAPRQMATIDEHQQAVVAAGQVELFVGGRQPLFNEQGQLKDAQILQGGFEVYGSQVRVN